MDLSNDINNIESLVNYDSDDSVADVDINGTNQPSFPDLDSSGCVVSFRKSLRYYYKIEFITLWLAVCQTRFNLSLDLDFSETRFRKSQRPEGGSEKTCFLNFVR